MAKWARLENNYVAELTNVDPIGRFHPSLVWEQVPEFVDDHFTFTENEEGIKTWHAPEPAEPTPLSAEQIAEIEARGAELAAQLAAQQEVPIEQTPAA